MKSYDPPKAYHSASLEPQKSTFGMLVEVLCPFKEIAILLVLNLSVFNANIKNYKTLFLHSKTLNRRG